MNLEVRERRIFWCANPFTSFHLHCVRATVELQVVAFPAPRKQTTRPTACGGVKYTVGRALISHNYTSAVLRRSCLHVTVLLRKGNTLITASPFLRSDVDPPEVY